MYDVLPPVTESEEKPLMTTPRLAPLLAQFDCALDQLATRLDGLSDAEYFWEPVPHCWSVRPLGKARGNRAHGAGGWVLEGNAPPPEPPPFTTIAWRLCHLARSMFHRADHTIGTRAGTREDYLVPGTAAEARLALDVAGSFWREALTSADDAALDQIGRSTYPYGSDPTDPFLAVVWWENRELIHHGAEIALLRDLYRASGGAPISRHDEQ